MFRKLKIDDKNQYQVITDNLNFGVKIDFALLFRYRDDYQYEIYLDDDIIIIKGKDFFYSPIASNIVSFIKAITLIKEYCFNHQIPCSIIAINNEELSYYHQLGFMTISYKQNEDFKHKPLLIHSLEQKYQAVLDMDTQMQLIYDASFNDSLAYKNYFFTKKDKQVRVLTENNIITSMLFYRKQSLSIKDSIYPAVILFGLATLPCYRNQGKMKILLSQTLLELYDNYMLAYLHPDVQGFYEKFGFVKFGAYPKPREVNTTHADNHLVQRIYNDYAKAYDLYTIRDEKFWDEYQEELASDGGYLEIFANKRGYLVHDGNEIIEYIDLDEQALNNDYNMIRIINLKKFLKTFNYQSQMNLQIIDDIIPENNILIKVNDGDITNISILDFSKTIFNNLTSLSLEKY